MDCIYVMVFKTYIGIWDQYGRANSGGYQTRSRFRGPPSGVDEQGCCRWAVSSDVENGTTLTGVCCWDIMAMQGYNCSTAKNQCTVQPHDNVNVCQMSRTGVLNDGQCGAGRVQVVLHNT